MKATTDPRNIGRLVLNLRNNPTTNFAKISTNADLENTEIRITLQEHGTKHNPNSNSSPPLKKPSYLAFVSDGVLDSNPAETDPKGGLQTILKTQPKGDITKANVLNNSGKNPTTLIERETADNEKFSSPKDSETNIPTGKSANQMTFKKGFSDNDSPVTADKHLLSGKDPPATAKEQRASNNGPAVTSDKQLVSGKDPPATAKEQKASNNGPAVTSEKQLVSGKDPPATARNQGAASSGPVATAGEQLVSGKDPPATTKEKRAIIGPALTSDKQFVSGKDPPATAREK
ncbi:unnamed protein product, partial [Enterobius vermicularis]|uniref:Organ specific protein n=1 Tax=Enterobius vermicularis TaxID=51028 RepID=A0A158QAF5_ENTVE